jgi:hypothetical protein
MPAFLCIEPILGHADRDGKCPLLGVKRTLRGRVAMSVIDPKRTSSMRLPGSQTALPMCSRQLAPAIVQRHDARLEPGRGHELQAQWWLQAGKQVWTVPGHHGVDHEAIFVHEVQALKRS